MGIILTADVRAGTGIPGVLELGTNSLKLHLCQDDSDRFEPHRVEWDIGYEVYSSRRISEQTIATTVTQIQTLLGEHRADPANDPIFGIATGAFRDAENGSALLDRLYDELGVPVRILKVKEEASLLIEGASRLVRERPGMAFDLGGGSLEMVYIGRNGVWLRDDLRLGAIRIRQLASLASGEWDESHARQYIDEILEPARAFRFAVIHGTGGTVKAIAQVAGVSAIPLEGVRAMEEAARRGPPQELSDRRRELFLPGLMVVRRLMEHVGAKHLRYTRVDLGDILLERLKPIRGALRGRMTPAFLHHQLDIFRP